MTLPVVALAKSKFAPVCKAMLGLGFTGRIAVKYSVIPTMFVFLFPHLVFANKIVTVRGQGSESGYFELKDDKSLSLIKWQAKRYADKDAKDKCVKLSGSPHWELASYTSTCKPQPRYSAKAGQWHRCTVTVVVDCLIK